MTVQARRFLLVVAFLCTFSCRVLGQGWEHGGKVDRVEKRNDGAELSSGDTKIRITFFREGIVRVRVAPKGEFPADHSWAILQSPEPPSVSVQDGRDNVTVSSGNVVV